MTPAGATNIGDGLLTALSQLDNQDECSGCVKTIILLSDGDYNVGLPPESVLADLQKANVNVITATIGSSISVSGETALKNIANQTEGRYFRGKLGGDLLLFLVDFASYGIGGYKPAAFAPQVIASGQTKEVPVFVEAGAAKATFGVTIADEADNITLSLRKPSGAVLPQASGTNVEFYSASNIRAFDVTAPEAGTWSIIISAGSIRTGNLDAYSYIQHDGVDLFASSDISSVYTQGVKVNATPTYDGRNVVGSSMTGVVVRPDGTQVPITLYDDGLDEHGDMIAADGVYSEFFKQFTKDGAYTFKLVAQNTNGRLYEGEPLPDENGVVNTSPQPMAPPFVRAASTTAIVDGVSGGDTVWVDDSIPLGSTPFSVQDGWYWVSSNPAAIAGGAAHQSLIYDGYHQHGFEGATTKLPIRAGESLFAYVFLDPLNMPREIALQWHDGTSWEHRAYWGANNLGEWISASTFVEFGTNGTDSRRYMGPMPSAGRWVRLTVPASLVGLEGKTISGMAFTLDGGRATWDRIGKTNTLVVQG